jgi:hypothetical protein
MMGGNLAAGRFLCENRMTTLKQCFDALRNHKETEKEWVFVDRRCEEGNNTTATSNIGAVVRMDRLPHFGEHRGCVFHQEPQMEKKEIKYQNVEHCFL